MEAETTAPALQQNNLTASSERSSALDVAWREAKALAAADIVPQGYAGKPANCLIAIEFANRIGCTPMFVMQNTPIIHGRPGLQGQFAIALMQRMPEYADHDWEEIGKPGTDDWGKRFVMTYKDGRTKKGLAVTIALAKKEGWYSKSGSKWQTMPELMLNYRSASFFLKQYHPTALMGLPMSDEIVDVEGATLVSSTPASAVTVNDALKAAVAKPTPVVETKEVFEAVPYFDDNGEEVDVETGEISESGQMTFGGTKAPRARPAVWQE